MYTETARSTDFLVRSAGPRVQCCFTSTETVQTFRDGDPKTATSSFTQLLCSVQSPFTSVQCCFTFTETIRTVRDGEPRTATSTFTQLLSSLWSTKGWTERHTEPRDVPFPQTEQKRETVSSEPPLHGLSDCNDFPRAAGQFDS